MVEEKKDERKSYTFMDKRGRDSEETPQLKPAEDDVRLKPDEETLATGPERHGSSGSVPKIDFTTLIMSFASASMIAMGKIPDPVTGQAIKDLAVAQQNIDIITLLHEKSKENLTQEESGMMEHILYELRINFVDAMKEK
ncbi:MAG TPA: DUF1844 domain-containing protein [Deltaproteobacteria bacterium]|nr:DUF1844 domain-containing protein [Deltaproteobacteria bacterium]